MACTFWRCRPRGGGSSRAARARPAQQRAARRPEAFSRGHLLAPLCAALVFAARKPPPHLDKGCVSSSASRHLFLVRWPGLAWLAPSVLLAPWRWEFSRCENSARAAAGRTKARSLQSRAPSCTALRGPGFRSAKTATSPSPRFRGQVSRCVHGKQWWGNCLAIVSITDYQTDTAWSA